MQRGKKVGRRRSCESYLSISRTLLFETLVMHSTASQYVTFCTLGTMRRNCKLSSRFLPKPVLRTSPDAWRNVGFKARRSLCNRARVHFLQDPNADWERAGEQIRIERVEKCGWRAGYIGQESQASTDGNLGVDFVTSFTS